MIIKIIKENFEKCEGADSSDKPFIITLNSRDIFYQLFQKRILSFFKGICSYIYFSFPINKHYFRFSFYSKKDIQKFKLLYSPEQVVIISNTDLIVLKDKINSAYHNLLDLFISFFIYDLTSIFSKLELYEKMVTSILFKKNTVHFSGRLSFLLNYFIIKRRLNRNHYSLTQILNSPVYNLFSNTQKNDFSSLIGKNGIVLNSVRKLKIKYLIFGFTSKRRINTFIISLSILLVFTISIIYFSNKFHDLIIPFLILLQFFFLVIVFWIDYSKSKFRK